ncbi:polysaccharide deacetylase family protein [Legionella sp. D16C41]|uniref:polysaccharide deacetylase family protein n=1 Tax=Legionella sp. D16C41 TaxID=3402688 RepID=UPI003AF6591A
MFSRNAFVRIAMAMIMLLPLYGAISFIINFSKQIYCNIPTQKQPIPTIPRIAWPQHGLLTLWFDDAYNSQGSPALIQLMQKYGFVAAISVPTSFICKPGRLTWQQLQYLQNIGWEITSHSVSHYCNPNNYTSAAIIDREVAQSKITLESRSLRADNFVIPGGFSNGVLPNVVNRVKQFYSSYRIDKEQSNPLPLPNAYEITSYSINNTTDEKDIAHWINYAKEKNRWIILTIDQIDNKLLKHHISLDKLERIMNLITQEKIPVVLPDQVIQIAKIE